MIGPFLLLEENGFQNTIVQPQTPLPHPIHSTLVVQNKNFVSLIEKMIPKFKKELLTDNDDNFLFYLKRLLIDHIISKVFIRKKSIK